MNILFMGTPEFARVQLDALAGSEFNVAGVVTQPDKPVGRKRVLTPPPVKVFAEELGIPVYQPDSLRGEDFAALLERINPDAVVVAAYGKLLPANVLDFPRFGCINVHASLLPKYRGAAPINRAVMAGERVTGITTMYMDKGVDTGDMLLRAELEIGEYETAGDLHDRLAVLGASLLNDTLRALRDGTAVRTVQDDAAATYAAKILDSDCHIGFSCGARSVSDMIRGLSPSPGAFTLLGGRRIRLYGAYVSGEAAAAPPGTVVSVAGGEIAVAAGDGTAVIREVHPEGSRRMAAGDFIRGGKIKPGDMFE